MPAQEADGTHPIHRFPCLLPEEATANEVEMQFLRYQVANLPTSVAQAQCMDEVWHLLAQEKEIDTGLSKFGALAY